MSTPTPLHVSSLWLTFLMLLLLIVSSSQTPIACDPSNPATTTFRFCNAKLPISERVWDLVSRLTLDEKIPQLVNSAPPIPRLGIPAYQWWSESLHGLVGWKGLRFNGTIQAATSFPQVILLAASFDRKLWYRIGKAIGREARAMYNAGQATGLTFWAPNINIFRDPRWGRGQETPGEDPWIAGEYAVAYVRGIQGDSFKGRKLHKHLQASACCKHFTAYDLDNWNGTTRYVFEAQVTAQDLADTYQPPFKSCIVEGRASGIMCAYNRVNGVPNCADYNLLSRTARGQWGFHGYITSDCEAVKIIYDTQGYAKSPEDATADVLNAGMDVNCGSYLKQHTKAAVQQKILSEQGIDRALHSLFSVRMRLGLFDGNKKGKPYGNIKGKQVCSEEHKNLALEAARHSIVLLKNSNRLLPLSKAKTKTLGVIGPNADSPRTLLGNYAGPPCESITPLEALDKYASLIQYHSGCDTVECSSISVDEAVKIAKEVDYVVMVMGLDLDQETEEKDRSDLVLPGKQQELISNVAQAAKYPVILVLLCGGPVDITFAKDDAKVGGILWVGYPGEAGGNAIAEIIFGEHNPGAKLPITWYPQDFIKVPMTDMRMRPDRSSGYPGQTYRFYTGQKVFEFGYGLSYTTYSYKFYSVSQDSLYLNQSASAQIQRSSDSMSYKLVSDLGKDFCAQTSFSVVIIVENQGKMEGTHPVLLFARNEEPENTGPIKQLIGFQSIHLNVGESAKIEFLVNPCEHLQKANEDGLMIIEEGAYFLVVGEEEYPIMITF